MRIRPALLVATLGPALTGGAMLSAQQPSPGFTLGAETVVGGACERGAWGLLANGGVHFIHNAGHVTSGSDTKWVGTVTLAYRFHAEGALP